MMPDQIRKWKDEPKEWRPLSSDEFYAGGWDESLARLQDNPRYSPNVIKIYPPITSVLGQVVFPVYIYDHPSRCDYGLEGERCLLKIHHDGPHKVEVKMER